MIHKLAQSIAEQVKESGFSPDVIVAIGTGGFIPARILRTYLGKPILAVGIAYYDLNDRPMDYPRKGTVDRRGRKAVGRQTNSPCGRSGRFSCHAGILY